MNSPKSRNENSDKPRSRGRQPALTENSVGQRILQALGDNSRSWLAHNAKLPESTIGDAIKRGPARTEVAIKIAAALDVSLDWLMGVCDDPTMSLAEQRSGYVAPPSQSKPEPKVDRADLVEVAEIDLRYGLGGTYLDDVVQSEARQFSRAWLRHFTDSPPGELFWAKGQGNSMESTIHESDIVLIDRRQDSPRIADLIWAFAFGEIGMIKRLRPMPDGSVKILSDNPAVPPEVAHDGELHIIGRVVAVVKKL